jgi:hypothetical protein
MLEKRKISLNPIETLISNYGLTYKQLSDIINIGKCQMKSKDYIDINYLAHNIYKYYGLSTVNKRFFITRRMKRLKDYYLNLCENYKFVYNDIVKLKFEDIVDIDFPKYQKLFVELEDVDPMDFIRYHEDWKSNAKSKDYETARLKFVQPSRKVTEFVTKELWCPEDRGIPAGIRSFKVPEYVEKPHECFITRIDYLEGFDVVVKNKKRSIELDQKVIDKKAEYDELKSSTIRKTIKNQKAGSDLFEERRHESKVKDEIYNQSAQMLYQAMYMKRTMNIYNIIEKYHDKINTDIIGLDSLARVTQRLENFKKLISSKIKFGNLVKYVDNKIKPALIKIKTKLANNYRGCKVYLKEDGELNFKGSIDLPYKDMLIDVFYYEIYHSIVGDIEKLEGGKTIENMVNEIEEGETEKCYLVSKENLPHYLMKRAGNKKRYLKMLGKLDESNDVKETIYSINLLHMVDMPKEFHFKFLGLHEITNHNPLLKQYIRNNKCKNHFDLL